MARKPAKKKAGSGYFSGGVRIPIPGTKKTADVRWVYSDDPEEIRFEYGEWCVNPGVNEDLDELEEFEECDAWVTDSTNLLDTLWPEMEKVVRKKVELPTSQIIPLFSRVLPSGGATLLTWTWDRKSDRTEPTVLALVPHELLPHLPCVTCRKILARFDDREHH